MKRQARRDVTFSHMAGGSALGGFIGIVIFGAGSWWPYAFILGGFVLGTALAAWKIRRTIKLFDTSWGIEISCQCKEANTDQ